MAPSREGDLLALDDDMRRFFDARIDTHASERVRMQQMVAAITGDSGRGIVYAPAVTYSARGTFRARCGNCLSLSLLTVAVARLVGLKARFCEVNTFPRWDRTGGLVTEIRHMNVRVWADGRIFELNLLPADERRDPVADSRVVSDARAFASYYNNLAVQRLAAGAAVQAQNLFDRALAADPTAAFIWANKAGALRLAGDRPAALACLERAVRENPRELSAAERLAEICSEMGRSREAARWAKKAEQCRRRNPYYLSYLARGELAGGRWREAERNLRRAIAIKDDEPEFLELRILVAKHLGRTADVRRWTARLQALHPVSPAGRTDPP